MPTAVGSGTVDCCGKAGVLLRAEHVLVLRWLGEKSSLWGTLRARPGTRQSAEGGPAGTGAREL